MSSVMHPVGDKPPNVYWRRRVVALVALLVVLLVLVLVVKAVAGLFGGGNTATTPTPSTTPSVAASTTASASGSATSTSSTGPTQCGANSVKVTATSDSKSVTVGSTMKVGMLIENVGQTDCTLDAGSANLELTISSGNERIWSSDDCQKGGESRPTTIAPGAKLASEVAWDLKRSANGCPANLPKLQAGTYQLKARVGELNSEPLTFMVKSAS